MRARWLLLVLIATGCTPRIHDTPGFYACAGPGDCPSIAPFCVDLRCHPTPTPMIDAGGPSEDAGAIDGGLPPPDGGPRPDGAPPRDGGPPPPCSTSAECGGAGLCVAGGCRRFCSGDVDCEGLECLGATSGGAHANVCLPPDVARMPPYYEPCPTDCGAPFECIEGNCMRSCEGPTLCLDDETCQRSAPGPAGEMRLTCVEQCTDGLCPTGARCVMPPGGSGPNICIVW